MSSDNHIRQLLNRGRKAGLSLRELYSALATLPAEASSHSEPQVDGNGYIATVDEQGRREYRPLTESPSNAEIPVPTPTPEQESQAE